MDKKIIENSIEKAIISGKSGFMAMTCQVTSLMWLRTAINYQYRYGVTTTQAFKNLYKDGGILRFYRGFIPALLQAPLSRFGDTAMNTGVIFYLDQYNSTKDLPVPIKTFLSSTAAGIWRINLMPIDTCKTILQVEGKKGLNILINKIRQNGISVLYNGGLASCFATMIGHFPWFFTYNTLNEQIPQISYKDDKVKALVRNASIGFCSSFVSDIVSNSSRVIKVYKQTYNNQLEYTTIIKNIIKDDGITGFLGRGLKTKIISNGIQAITFTVLWKYFQENN